MDLFNKISLNLLFSVFYKLYKNYLVLDRENILFTIDVMIRDAKARLAYS